MPQQQTPTVTAIFSDVLANLAFMFTDDELAEPSSGDLWLTTTISYRGPASGVLRFLCTKEFSELLAANLLGTETEDEDARAKAQDAVKEFMNIVCGQFVTARHGTEDVFDLSIPQIQELQQTPGFATRESDQVASISVEGHRVQLSHEPAD